jgi:hypothetical protein
MHNALQVITMRLNRWPGCRGQEETDPESTAQTPLVLVRNLDYLGGTYGGRGHVPYERHLACDGDHTLMETIHCAPARSPVRPAIGYGNCWVQTALV